MFGLWKKLRHWHNERMTAENSLLSYVAPALAGVAILCWFAALYFIVRFMISLSHLRRSTRLGWRPLGPPTFSTLFSWFGTLPPSCRVHVRTFFVTGGLFVALVFLGILAASIARPLRIHRLSDPISSCEAI